MTTDLRTQPPGTQAWITGDLVHALKQARDYEGRFGINPGYIAALSIAQQHGLVTDKEQFNGCIKSAGGLSALIDTLERNPSGMYDKLFPKE